MTTLSLTTLNLNSNNLDSYITSIGKIPKLSSQEEAELGHKCTQGDLSAAQQLIISQLDFVRRTSIQFLGYGLPQGDLIQEGNIGLMKAVKRFNPSAGVRLVSFAIHWIKAEMLEFVLRNWRMVKIATTKAQRKVFFKLRLHKQSISSLSQQDTSILADKIGVPSKDIVEMEKRFYRSELSYNAAGPDSDNDEDNFSPEHFLSAPDSDTGSLFIKQKQAEHESIQLQNALNSLSDRDKHIIESRWLTDEEDKPKLRELAVKYGVSTERIRQLERNSIAKLKIQMSRQ